MPARPALTLEAIPESVPKIFEQAQVSAANHQKNYVALNKIHKDASSITKVTDDGEGLQLIGEKAFEDIFINMLLRVLPIKKGANVVDRVIRFVSGYVKFISDKISKEANEGEVLEEDTAANRFIERLVKYLLKGFEGKDKNVRFRVLQLVAELVPSMANIDESLLEQLRVSLVERMHDKEPQVRSQVAAALCKVLALEEDEDCREEILDVLLDALKCDQATEVRKSVLLNIPFAPATLVPILSRIRDPETSIRRAVYDVVLSERLEHPKQLSISQREDLVRSGLRDRDPSVRAAAASLIGEWLDKSEGDLPSFVEMFDYDHVDAPDHISDPELAFAPAEEALLSAMETRTEITDNLKFEDDYWDSLTPTKAFIARVFVQHCLDVKDEARVEATMPVMTALAFKIQALYNELLQRMQTQEESRIFEENPKPTEEDRAIDNIIFVMQELLKLTVSLDSGDEIGRRRLFALVKDMTSQDTLPERLLPQCLDILRKLSSGERDLIRVVVEIIHDLRDVDKDDDELRGQSLEAGGDVDETPMVPRTPRPPKTPEDMTPEEQEATVVMDLRCLSLCIGLLERVNSSFEDNSTLEGVLGELILPAVKCKDFRLREKGLTCLGLCCLIARRLALNSLEVIIKQLNESPESLRIRIAQIVFDIMMVHEGDLFANATVGGDKVVEYLRGIFENEESRAVQAVLCSGLSKLMLSGMVTDEKVIKTLIIAYVSPDNADNQHVRQCLSYFFPVYCYSSSENQRRIQAIFLEIYHEIRELSDGLDEEQEMIGPLHVASLLADWTDPQKVIEVRGQTSDKYVHYDLAVQIIKALFDKDVDKEDKKVMCQVLGKLYIPDDVDDDKIRTLKLLVNNMISRRPMRDSSARSAFNRFDAAISKKFAQQLQNFNEEEYRQLEELKDLFEFIDDIIPDASDEEIELPKRGSRKRRSESVATTTTATTAGEEDYDRTPESRVTSRGKAAKKKRRISKSDDDGISDVEATPPPPSRTMPRRAATKPVGIIEEPPNGESSDDDERASTAPKRGAQKQRGVFKQRRNTEQRLDDEISELLGSDESQPASEDDSILDAGNSDDEEGDNVEVVHEEEGEVDDLL